MLKLCRCRGMNEECLFCGGSGFEKEEEVQIIKIFVDENVLTKQDAELQSYLHPRSDKLYQSKNKSVFRKQNKHSTKQGKLKAEESLRHIGPDNPNRNTATNTPPKKLGRETNIKHKEKKDDTEVQNPEEKEFSLFWSNHIRTITKDNTEFSQCLLLFLKLKPYRREKFKLRLAKNHSQKAEDMCVFALKLFDKLSK